MLFPTKLARMLVNPIFMGKVFAAGTQIIIILLAARILEAEQANLLYSLLAVSAIVSAVSSFGANGALVPFLFRHSERTQPIVILLIAGKAIVSVLTTLVLVYSGFSEQLSIYLIVWTAFSSSLLFIDFVAESQGLLEVEVLSRLKFLVFGAGILLKTLLFFVSFDILLIVLYVEWPIIWGLYIFKRIRIKANKALPGKSDIFLLAQFLKKSSWVWLSSVISFGWTRAYFLILTEDLGVKPANAYFLIMRLVEGFVLIPNTLAMRYFPEMVKAHQRKDLTALSMSRTVFIKKTVQASFGAAIGVPVFLFLIYGWNEEGADYFHLSFFQQILIAMSAFLIMLRVALSREIILSDKLHLSLTSYFVGVVTSYSVYLILGSNGFDDALVGYFFFALLSLISPFVFYPSQMKSFLLALVNSFNIRQKQ